MTTPHSTPYTESIRMLAPTYDPWQVESWMRNYLGTLDHLDARAFAFEVNLACRCIDADPIGTRRLAATYGWNPQTQGDPT